MSIYKAKNFSGKVLAGSVDCFENTKCYQIFDPQIMAFFDDCSRLIRKVSRKRNYDDLLTFAFFCRKANLSALAKNYGGVLRIGLGRGVHIAPGNVPVNLAFTLLFGLISGNACLVRAPTKSFPQLELLYEIIQSVLDNSEYLGLGERFCIFQCEHDDPWFIDSLSNSRSRVVWGGDITVRKIKQIDSRLDCTDLVFGDRVSLAIIDAASISELHLDEVSALGRRFCNDTILFDQNACSSPVQILWLNFESHKDSVEKFWSSVAEAEQDYMPIGAKKFIDKLVNVTKKISTTGEISMSVFSPGTFVLDPIKASDDWSSIRLGLYPQIPIEDIKSIKNYVSAKTQTITYFGLDPVILAQQIIDDCLEGVDRIVPVGDALDIGFVWDGKDVVRHLSRVISVK